MTLALPTRARRLKRLAAVLLVLAAYIAATAAVARRYSSLPDDARPRCEIRGEDLYRNGEKLFVKAVGYDPARPGELPWARRRSAELLDSDLGRIRAAGFNAIRVWEALSRDELAAAERHGLAVIQGIWVDPDGAFSDPEFRRAAAAKAADLVRLSRGSRAVILYLVMNEPRPARVAAEGPDALRALLRELAATVRALDPGAPVAFSSWPGLEFVDEPALDLVAANLYPFRPSALIEAVGYAGMVELWKRRVAGERPLLVTEFGVSVSPDPPRPDGPGGATEQEQARALPRLADAIARAGGAGGAVFMWIDGWWKNADREGDEMRHDPDDGEEWFGLNAMERLGDTIGRPRAALGAMRAWNRAVLTLPRDGPAGGREVEVEAHVEERGEARIEARIEASIEGGEPVVVPAVREGPWVRGRLGLLARARGPQRLELTIRSGDEVLARAERVVIPAGEGPSVELLASGTGGRRTVVARVRDGAGRPLAGARVRISTSEATRRFDRVHRLTANEAGEAAVSVEMPPAPARLLAAAGVWDERFERPIAVDWAVIEPEPAK